MKPASVLVAVLLSASLQAAAPAAPPDNADTPRRIAAAEQVQVNLVLIDVVVRDNKGNPVRGLTQDAFELLVDRLPVEPAAIESFEAVCPSQPEAQSTASAGADATGAPASPSETGQEPAAPRHIVVVFDFSHLSLSGRRQSLQAARSYFSNRLTPNDQVMLLAYKGGMHLLQDFTSTPSLLVARIDELLPDTSSLEGEVLEEGSKMTDVARRACEGGLADVGTLQQTCLATPSPSRRRCDRARPCRPWRT
jgi:VWFA-related protein